MIAIKPLIDTIIDNRELIAKLKWNPESVAQIEKKYMVNGSLQTFIDAEFMRSIEPYMQLKSGEMIRSMPRVTVVGSGLVRIRTHYAKHQYFAGREAGKSPTGALRGRMWVPRWKADNWNSFMQRVRAFAGKRGA